MPNADRVVLTPGPLLEGSLEVGVEVGDGFRRRMSQLFRPALEVWIQEMDGLCLKQLPEWTLFLGETRQLEIRIH